MGGGGGGGGGCNSFYRFWSSKSSPLVWFLSCTLVLMVNAVEMVSLKRLWYITKWLTQYSDLIQEELG